MKKYLIIFVAIVAVIAIYSFVSSQLSNVSIVRVTKNCPTHVCDASVINADVNSVQMYFAETGGEAVLDTIPNFLCKLVSNKVMLNANKGMRFVLGEIHKSNLSGSKTEYNGLNLKWKSDDALGTNSTIKIWSKDTPEPEYMHDKFASLK